MSNAPSKHQRNPQDRTESAQRARPAKYAMPAPIPDTPENIARAIFNTPPKKRSDWKYLQDRKARTET